MNYVVVRWLSGALNRYKETHDIDIGAAIAFMGIPHVKVVAAWGMMMEDFCSGIYDDIDTLVVPSSGNTVQGVALLAPAFGISRVKAIMASDIPEAKKNVVAMIPWVRVIHPEGTKTVEDVALEEASISGSHLVDQYKHLGNIRIHETCTSKRLLHATGGNPGLVVASMGSGGTIGGIATHLKEVRPDTIIIGARAKPGERIPAVRDAHRMSEVVTLPYADVIDGIEEVGRKESFIMTRRLLGEVQPQVGPSSGAACAALFQYLEHSPSALESLRGKKCVFVCPDDGRFYQAPTAAELDPDQ